jgi:hypothetical protein
VFYESVFLELDQRNIRYLVIGGIAVNLHGFSRATGDLDIMLSFDRENLEKFIDMINSLEFKPRAPVKIEELGDPIKVQMWEDEKNMKVFSVYNPLNVMEQVDIMIEDYIDFERAYDNREVLTAKNIRIPVISIDDLITLKEKAGRERDKIDIKALRKIKELKSEGY